MATFITTLHFTEQGIKAVRDTCERAAAFKSTAKKLGVTVKGTYWTLGAFDGRNWEAHAAELAHLSQEAT